MSMITLKRKTGNGRPKGSTNLLKKPKNDINEIFDILNEEQRKEIIEDWLKIQREKKDKNTLKHFASLSRILVLKNKIFI
jgi:putative transposase